MAYRWVGIPIFISTAVVAAFFPRSRPMAKRGGPEFAAQVNQAVLLVLLAAVPARSGSAWSPTTSSDFLYEPEFDDSIVLIQILALHIPLAAMDTILATALIAADRQRRYIVRRRRCRRAQPDRLRHRSSTGPTDAYGNGAIGAAIVTVATELFIMCGALRLRSPGVLDRATVWNVPAHRRRRR